MDFKDWMMKDPDIERAIRLLTSNAFGLPLFDKANEFRRKQMIHLAADGIALDDAEKYKKIYDALISYASTPKQPAPETPKERERRLKMQFGSDRDKD